MGNFINRTGFRHAPGQQPLIDEFIGELCKRRPIAVEQIRSGCHLPLGRAFCTGLRVPSGEARNDESAQIFRGHAHFRNGVGDRAFDEFGGVFRLQVDPPVWRALLGHEPSHRECKDR